MSETDTIRLSAANRQITPVIDASSVFQPLALRAMFWRPSYLEASAWLEYIPFAFWMIEAHQPRVFVELGSHYCSSYFAFCQAVERLGLDTQCFAIDTWMDHKHPDLYDECMFDKVNAHNESQYAGFSRLMRRTSDNAVRHFTDGTVDLLHIDGLHTLDTIRHDFETWLPKLSEYALVLVHGTNSRERNFGVFKLFEQLKTQYPVFEFGHGQGLGVIGVGARQSDLTQHLFKSNKNELARRAIHEVFSRLGRACADSSLVIRQKGQVHELSELLNKQKNELEVFKQAIERAQADLANRSKELNDTKSKMNAQIEHHAIERGQLSERVTLLQEIRADLKKEIERLQTRIDANSSDLLRRMEELARFEQAINAHQQEFIKNNSELQLREGIISALREEGAKRHAEIESLQAMLTERENELVNTQSMYQSQTEENSRFSEEQARLVQENADGQHQLDISRGELQLREGIISALREEGAKRHAEIESLQAMLAERENELVNTQSMYQSQTEENSRFSEEQARLVQENADGQHQLDISRGELQLREGIISALREEGAKRHAEIESLQAMLAERENELVNTQSMYQSQTEENSRFSEEQARLVQENADGRHQLDISRGELQLREGIISALREEGARRHAEIESLQAMLAERENELVNTQSMYQSQTEENSRFSEEQARLVQENAAGRHQLDISRGELQLREGIISALREEGARRHAEIESLQAMLTERENELVNTQSMYQSQTEENSRFSEEQARLVQENAAGRHQLNSIRGELQERDGMIAKLRSDKEALSHSAADGLNELAKLTQMQQSTEQALNQLKARLVTENKTHTALRVENEKFGRSVSERFKELAQLTQLLIERDQTLVQKNQRMDECFKELAQLTQLLIERDQMLVQKNQQLTSLRKEVGGLKQSFAWRMSQSVHSVGERFRTPDKLKQQKELIIQSGLFDTEWYLQQYPDVAKNGTEPIEHYLLFGAIENRDPSPAFCTGTYRTANRDALTTGENPLLHYLTYGRQNAETQNQIGVSQR